MAYLNNLSEPPPLPLNRSVKFTVSDGINTTECVATINVSLVNDNAPLLDLNGANPNTTDFNVSLLWCLLLCIQRVANFTYCMAITTVLQGLVVFSAENRMPAAIAEQSVISDADLDSVVHSMVVSLMSVHEGDSLFVDGCSSSANEMCLLQ